MSSSTKTIALTCFLAIFSLFGQDSKERDERRDRETKEEQIEQVLNTESAKKLSKALNKKVKTKLFCSNDPVFYLPEDGHYLNTASNQRKAITLEDGSVWKVSNYDLNTLYGWHPGDFLYITQSKSWFPGKYVYRIINYRTKDSVDAYLYESGFINGEHSHPIFAMDLDIGEVVFNDHNGDSCWQLCEADRYKFEKWAINDLLIIGINTGYRSDYTHILINPYNDKEWVRARRY